MPGSIAIVGAGPAGAFCAWRLAAAGLEVTVYDPSHPREKPCGGGVTMRVFERWPELADLRSLGRSVDTVRMRGPRAPEVRFALPARIEVIARSVLDGAILERAVRSGATHDARRVRSVARSADGTMTLDVGGEAVEHDLVIGADGATSIVRRSLLGGRPGSSASYATAGFHVRDLPENDIVIEILGDATGYIWVFPRPGHASVGIAVPVGHTGGEALRARVLAFLERRYPEARRLPREPYGAAIPVGGGRVAGPGFALIGDAANATDAITGEGIHHAIDGAGILADTIIEVGTTAAPEAFSRRWQAGPGGDLAAGRRLARALYRPLVVDASLVAAARSSRLRWVMAATAVEERPYRGLPGRLWSQLLLGRIEGSSAAT